MKFLKHGVLLLLVLPPTLPWINGCTTTFVEFRGECVIQDWKLFGASVRQRQICDLPPPQEDVAFDPETDRLRDREAMDTNPFPDFTDRLNKADSFDPNLLEKSIGLDPEAPIETPADD